MNQPPPPRSELEMFVVYAYPHDYPGKYVVRKWWIGRQPGKPLADAEWLFLGDSLEEVRAHIPQYCTRLDRDPNDEPHIVEVWI